MRLARQFKKSQPVLPSGGWKSLWILQCRGKGEGGCEYKEKQETEEGLSAVGLCTRGGKIVRQKGETKKVGANGRTSLGQICLARKTWEEVPTLRTRGKGTTNRAGLGAGRGVLGGQKGRTKEKDAMGGREKIGGG